MSSPIRTQEKMTAGLVCVPLTKPATVFFISPDNNHFNEVERCLASFKISYDTTWRNGKAFTKSLNQIEPKLMKQIRRNFTTLKPKFISDWRYPVWEIDNKEQSVLLDVLQIYAKWELPVIVQETMRGYHFICVKPIAKSSYLKEFIPQLRFTNPRYPPIAIRILGNKWVGEKEFYSNVFVQSAVEHSDSMYMARWLRAQDVTKIAQQYYVVSYPLPEEKPPVNNGAIKT